MGGNQSWWKEDCGRVRFLTRRPEAVTKHKSNLVINTNERWQAKKIGMDARRGDLVVIELQPLQMGERRELARYLEQTVVVQVKTNEISIINCTHQGPECTNVARLT